MGGSSKFVNIMTPGAAVPVLGRSHNSYMVKMLIFNSSTVLLKKIRQTKFIVMMTKEGSTKSVESLILR